MINFANTKFVKSATGSSDTPKDLLPEILIVGKSNVGKSTLINTLTSQTKLAKTSSKPGHTKLLNYFIVDNKFYLVDAPGYGYANGGVNLDRLFGNMMSDYFSSCEKLKLVMLLVDSRREFSEHDLEIIDLANEIKVPLLFVITKCDKINQKEKAALLKYLNENDVSLDNVCFVSNSNSKLTNDLKGRIEKYL